MTAWAVDAFTSVVAFASFTAVTAVAGAIPVAFAASGGDDGDVGGGFAARAGGGFGFGFAEQAEGQKGENLLEGGLFGGAVGAEGASAVAVTIAAAVSAAIVLITTWTAAVPAAPVVGALRGVVV